MFIFVFVSVHVTRWLFCVNQPTAEMISLRSCAKSVRGFRSFMSHPHLNQAKGEATDTCTYTQVCFHQFVFTFKVYLLSLSVPV